MASHDTFTIHLPQFEGPFDLLLFFIERDELDINDIPIGKITDDFLDYLHQMERLNIDLASEFILVGATLCRIKARMLLPRKQFDEQGKEIDPREELVQRLLEYKRYKSVLDEMRQMEESRSLREVRGNVSDELQRLASRALVDSELESLTLFRLLRSFEQMMARFEQGPPKAVHQIAMFNYSIEEQQVRILESVGEGKRTDFQGLFGHCENRIHAIITFLALLELLNLEKVALVQGMGENNFWVEKTREPHSEEE